MNNTIDLPLKSSLNIFLYSGCFLLLAACTVIENKDQQSRDKNIFISNVIDVEEEMLYPGFWANKITGGNKKILTTGQINRENTKLYQTNSPVVELAKFSDMISGSEIADKILRISSAPSSTRYYSDGKEVTKDNYNFYNNTLDITAIPSKQTVKFGMVVRRTDMRTFPTSDKVYKTANSTNLDRFQETALFPTEVVAILHQSRDQQWYFGVSYNYAAWFKKADIAIGDRKTIFAYKKSKDFIVVTGSKIFTSYNAENNNVSEVQLEMGTILPLVKADHIPANIAGHNTYSSHVVLLPTKNNGGTLLFQPALIAKSADVHRGFLPYTKNNIINQSFKFLGERYGWGHSFNARDCTGFVGEVFKTFGILMPRNSGQQAESAQGKNAHFLKTATKTEKLDFIKQLDVGDLIYRPGHVMLFLGYHGEKPFIIHDVSDFGYFKSSGEYYSGKLNGVSVTPILPMQLSEDTSYVDKIYNIKKIK